MRSQCADCPICRLPFKALLRLRAVQSSEPAGVVNSSLLSTSGIDPSFALSSPNVMNGNGSNGAGTSGVEENTPPGYQAVSLMEALYGAYAANWKKSRPNTSLNQQRSSVIEATSPPVVPPLNFNGYDATPLPTAAMATPKPTRQTPVFGRQPSNNAEDGIKASNISVDKDSELGVE